MASRSEDPAKESAKRALESAARKTKAAADAAATQRAADFAAQDVDREEMDRILSARQNAALEQGSQIAAAFSPVKEEQGTNRYPPVPTAQPQLEPGISPPRPDPTAGITSPIPTASRPSVDRRVECQKFLYAVANQTAANATAQIAAAEDLATNALDTCTREEAKDQAAKARFNLGLAKQMAEAAQSPTRAFQAVAAIQNVYSGNKTSTSECDPKESNR